MLTLCACGSTCKSPDAWAKESAKLRESFIIRIFYYTSLNVLSWLLGVDALRRCLTQNAFKKAEQERKGNVLLKKNLKAHPIC